MSEQDFEKESNQSSSQKNENSNQKFLPDKYRSQKSYHNEDQLFTPDQFRSKSKRVSSDSEGENSEIQDHDEIKLKEIENSNHEIEQNVQINQSQEIQADDLKEESLRSEPLSPETPKKIQRSETENTQKEKKVKATNMWKSLTMGTIKRYDWDIKYLPQPVDPINGLIKASGHFIIHLAFFFSIFFVKKAQGNITCYTEDEQGFKVPKDINVDLNQDLQFLQIMHLVCYVFQGSTVYFESYYPQFHLPVVMSIMSIFAYQSLILGSQTSIMEVKAIFSDPACSYQDTGNIIQWLILEITAFYINILVNIYFTINTYGNIDFVKAIHINKLALRRGSIKFIKHQKNPIGVEDLQIRIFQDHKHEKVEKFEQEVREQTGIVTVKKVVFKQEQEEHTKFEKLWRTQTQLNIMKQRVSVLSIPETLFYESVGQYFYHRDLLKYAEGGYSFSRITASQFMIGIASILLQYSINHVGNLQFEECSSNGGDANSLIILCVILMIIDLAKVTIFEQALIAVFQNQFEIKCFCGIKKEFKVTVRNLLLTFLVVNLLMMFIAYGLITNEDNCQLFLSNFIIFDMICSYISLLNLWRENSQLEYRYLHIAKSFLRQFYDDEDQNLQNILNGKNQKSVVNENRQIAKLKKQMRGHQSKCNENQIVYEDHQPEWQTQYLQSIKDQEEKNEDTQMILELKPDIYCLAFLKFIQVQNAKLHRQLMLKCVLAFIVQILLCALVYGETKGLQDIFTGKSNLNGARLVCSFLLHINILSELKNSLDMIRYTINNKKSFKGHGYYLSFLILCMRFLGNFFTELINVWKMGQVSQIEDVVKDFIAFGIIAEIDDLVASTIMNMNIDDELADNEIPYSQSQNHLTFREMFDSLKQQSCSNLEKYTQIIFLIIYSGLNWFYVVVYFYFFPFCIVFLIFIFGNDKLQQ